MSVVHKRSFPLFFLVVCIITIDFISKSLVLAYLPQEGDSFTLFTNFFGIDFSLTHASNKGAAWGVFSSWPNLLVTVRILFIAFLSGCVVLKKFGRMEMAVCGIIGGASANVIDFFLYGHVIDMFRFTFWGCEYPIFNVADSAIFVGTLTILWLLIKEK
jgi:signal peptidase II